MSLRDLVSQIWFTPVNWGAGKSFWYMIVKIFFRIEESRDDHTAISMNSKVFYVLPSVDYLHWHKLQIFFVTRYAQSHLQTSTCEGCTQILARILRELCVGI